MEIILIENSIFLNKTFLKKFINHNTVNQVFKRKSSACIISQNEKYIKHSALPGRMRQNLPTDKTLLELKKDQEINSYVNALYNEFSKAFFLEATKHRTKYSNYGLPPEKILHCSRLHAVWEKVLSSQGAYGWLQTAHKAFNKLFPNKYKTYNSFANALSKAKKSIESVSYDERLIKSKTKVYDEQIYIWLASLLSHSKKLRYREIATALDLLCNNANIINKPTNFLEWVKKHGKRLQENIEIYSSRYGSQEGKKRLPYTKMIPALNPLTQIQIDGFTVPVYYQNESTTWAKLILFAVVDSHSKKIIGYEIADSEDTNTILKGIKDAVSKTGFLPFEIVSDNHSANKTDELKFFKEELQKYGVNLTISENPQHKSVIERTFKHLNEFHFKQIPGWTGQGVLSKEKNGRPSQEYIDHYQKSDTRRTRGELELWIIKSIEEYNNAPLNKNGKSPNQIFNEVSISKSAVPVTIFDIAKIFDKAKKAKVQRGQINITRAGVKHEFQLDAEIMSKYNDKEVLVRYEDLRESIYLYDLKNDMPICEVKPKESIHGALGDQTEEDKIKLLKHTGRLKGYKSKAQKENAKLAHPDAIHDLNKILQPKDIVKEFRENSDLKKEAALRGINIDHVVTGNNRGNFIAPSLIPADKKNKSPFHSDKGKLEKIDLQKEFE